MANLIIGVDIGGTRTKSGLVNIDTGEVLKTIVQPTEKNNAELFLNQIGDVIEQFKTIAHQLTHEIGGIGIGVPGFIGKEGEVVTTYGFLAFMENYDLASLILHKFSLECLLENDARVVSLGEALYGKGKLFERVLTLTLGTGVGFGFVVDGGFVDAMPMAHMGGHIKITDEGEPCYCGKVGCLEALVSSTGILNAAKNTQTLSDISSAEDVFIAAQQGNEEALAVVEQIANYLHTAVYNYVNLFAPDIIVLGGGIAKGMLPYLPQIKKSTYLPPYPGYEVELTVSELEELAGMLGSAALFHQTLSIPSNEHH